MKKLFLFFLLLLPVLATTSGTIAGTFKYPDGTPVTGRVVVQLSAASVANGCASNQTISFRQVVTQIVSGTMSSVSLYTSNCLKTGVARNAAAVGGPGAGASSTVAITGAAYGTLTVTAGDHARASVGTTNPQAVAIIALHVPPLLFCYVQSANSNAAGSGVTYAISQGRSITINAGHTALVNTAVYQWQYACVLPYTVAVYDSGNKLMYRGRWVVPSYDLSDPRALLPVDVTLLDTTQLEY